MEGIRYAIWIWIWLLVWLPCGIATIIISSRRGAAEGCASVFTGLLFGPLALIVALIFTGKKRCPYCQEQIQKTAKICPYCKTENPFNKSAGQ